MLSRQNRLTDGDDYRTVVRKGHKAGSRTCLVYAYPLNETTQARFGFIVSKAVGGAVMRNLVRRRLKDTARRQLQAGFAGFDVVIRALPASVGATFAELNADVSSALSRATRVHNTEKRTS